MSEFEIPLNLITANPWQPREQEDPDHIRELAASIERDSLLQRPVVRLVDENAHLVRLADLPPFGDLAAALVERGWRVQLAFGHSRYAAYKLLAAEGKAAFERLPAEVRDLDDEALFRLMVSENVKRKALGPIEEARSMLVYRDHFGKTSAEIGALYGLAESSVRNKLRLLNLPPDLVDKLRSANVSERAARELLALYELPDDVRRLAANLWPNELRPAEIVKAALEGAASDILAARIDRLAHSAGEAMDRSLFKHERVFEGEFRSPACKDCALRLMLKDGPYCYDRRCFNAKQIQVKLEYLTEASAACGIQPAPVEDIELLRGTEFSENDRRDMAKTRCQNLRLVYSDRERDDVEGWPHAKIVCHHLPMNCVCKRALNAGIKLEPTPQPQPAPAETYEPVEDDAPEAAAIEETPGEAPLVTAEQLREADRKIRAAKRQTLVEVRAMRDDMAYRLYQALEDQNPEVWRMAAGKMLSWQKRDALKGQPVSEVWRLMAEALAADLYDWSYTEPSLERAESAYNRALTGAGLATVEAPQVESE
ncbi:MAG TPA: ParB N-terminal domain-containing protein [Bellilinea sp.]|nr:ParB N-terminal domain-containing protein [Bellilinea sp.]